jgi:hypothetical protein
VNIFPYIFLGYLAIGITWILLVHRRTPGYAADVRQRVYSDHGQEIKEAPARRIA